MRIGRATPDELPEVLRLLNDAADWMHRRGLDQWPDGMPASRIGPMVAQAEFWLARKDDRAVGTIAMSADADAEFWTPDEAHDLAVYVSKLAIDRAEAGSRLGELILRWITDYAGQLGYDWVRLDAWKTNPRLHDYYLQRGWTHVRTVDLPHRHSGALFQRPTLPDIEARAAFEAALAGSGYKWLEPGTPVTVGARGSGVVVSVDTGEHEVLPALGNPKDTGAPSMPGYLIRFGDGSLVRCQREDVSIALQQATGSR